VSEKSVTSRRKLLLSIFVSFLKIGAFTWGGGYAMIPLIKSEVVDKKKWLSTDDFINGIAVAQTVPGAIAINSATFVGYRVVGTPGAISAALGAVLPSFVSIVVVAIFFLRFGEVTVVQNFFRGATPAIVALLINAVINLGKDALKEYREIIVAVALLFLLLFFHIHPILAIAIAAVVGLFFRRPR
jgi:chromate transporter